jgi:hypothetical protein
MVTMKKLLIFILISLTSLSFSFESQATTHGITGPDVVYKQANKVLTTTSILGMYESSNGAITIKTDGYTGNGDKPGIYQIVLEDSGGTKSIDISVRSKLGNVIAVTRTNDAYTIHMHKNNTLTEFEIIKVLENVQLITYTSTTEIYILTNTYSDNADAPGNYTFEFYIANASGFEETIEIYLKVMNTEKLLPDLQIDNPTGAASLLKVLEIIGIIVLIVVMLLVLQVLNKRLRRKRG